MILIISFKNLGEFQNLKAAMFLHLKTIVGDTLVNEKGGLDETSEDKKVADDGLQKIHSFSPLGQ